MTGRIPRGLPLAGYGESKDRKPELSVGAAGGGEGGRRSYEEGRKLVRHGALGRTARTGRDTTANHEGSLLWKRCARTAPLVPPLFPGGPSRADLSLDAVFQLALVPLVARLFAAAGLRGRGHPGDRDLPSLRLAALFLGLFLGPFSTAEAALDPYPLAIGRMIRARQ
jgi:hypothetical protein